MEVYIARQPIFDINKNVYAYEILYRCGKVNSFCDTDPDEASSNVIINSFQVIGLDSLTGGKRAFINFTGKLLKQEIATLFPKDKLVVEVLETVKPDKDILEKCRELKKNGYMIALDDFVFNREYESLIEHANIIKVDFLSTSDSEKKNIVKRFGNRKIKFLAEKVETLEEFEKAKKWGYTYFQGYFFSKPVILSLNDVAPLKFNYLNLISKVNQGEFDFEEIADIVGKDISLSYKLLNLVNSAAFGFRKRIESVKQALVIVGIKEIKKWVSLIALKGIGEDKPYEVVVHSLLRGRFAENMALKSYLKKHSDELFLMGLFSLLDVLMGRPMEEIMNRLPVSPNVRGALVYREGTYYPYIELITAYEKGEWAKIELYSKKLGISNKEVIDAYVEATAWCDLIMGMK